MAKIKNVKGRQVFDSRGNPTVEAEVFLDNDIYKYGDITIVGSSLFQYANDMECDVSHNKYKNDSNFVLKQINDESNENIVVVSHFNPRFNGITNSHNVLSNESTYNGLTFPWNSNVKSWVCGDMPYLNCQLYNSSRLYSYSLNKRKSLPIHVQMQIMDTFNVYT